MGQYYKATILSPKNKKTVKAWVSSFDFDNGSKLMEHSWQGNRYVQAVESLIHGEPARIVWAGDYADNCNGRKSTLYHRCFDGKKINPTGKPTAEQTRFIVNHTKKMFVDKTTVPTGGRSKWEIHPLPLLTCEGNGRGGGDYGGDEAIVGSWARDFISVQAVAPQGYTELVFDLSE